MVESCGNVFEDLGLDHAEELDYISDIFIRSEDDVERYRGLIAFIKERVSEWEAKYGEAVEEDEDDA